MKSYTYVTSLTITHNAIPDIRANIEALSKGLYQMHKDLDCLGLLSFGMLDARLMDICEKELNRKLSIEIGEVFMALYPDHLKHCRERIMKEITLGVFNISEMVV